MFNPHQVREWLSRVRENPQLRRSYLGFKLGLSAVRFGSCSPPQDNTIERGRLEPPMRIFGSPRYPECMNGLGSWEVRTPPVVDQRLFNARVIGNSAVLADNGRLFAPYDVTTVSKDIFLEDHSLVHQGFLWEDGGDGVEIRFIERDVPKYFDQNALFFDNLEPGNFGSFMHRQFPQMMWAKERGDQYDCYITPERTPFYFEALDMLKLPPRPSYTVSEVSGDRFKSITMSVGHDAEGFLFPDFRRGVARITAEKLAQNSSQLHERIYVSRLLSGLRLPWYRVMKNEQEIEALATAAGYEVVYPEALTLKQQLLVFSGAKRIIGPSGSGMFNVMFSTNPKRLVDIETFHVTVRQHGKLYASCGIEYAFLFSDYFGDPGQDPINSPSLCPPPLFTEALAWLEEG